MNSKNGLFGRITRSEISILLQKVERHSLDGRRDILHMIKRIIHAMGQWICECGYVNWDSATHCGRCGRAR